MQTVPFLDLKAQYETIRDEAVRAVENVMASCRFALGPEVEAFEAEFADYCGVRYCVAVNSGTSALHLAMRCLDVGPGDEVITVPMTFVASAWAISYVGATPVFVDIDPIGRTMDPTRLAAAIGPKTKAILPVHLYGRPADMTAIAAVAEAHGLPVVEDAAQAHGACIAGRRVGSFGKMACFSFYPGKNLGACGEGGALVTDDADMASMARSLRDHGQRERYHHECVGYNYRMDAIQGAVLRIKLRRLDDWNESRRRHADVYRRHLANVSDLALPPEDGGCESVYHLFVVELEDRERIQEELQRDGVATGLHYPIPVHLQSAYRQLGHVAGDFPVSERLAERCLSLPMYAELTAGQIEHVCAALERANSRRSAVGVGGAVN